MADVWKARAQGLSSGEITLIALTGVLLCLLSMAPAAQAQNFNIINSFNGTDGRFPYAGLTMDRAGNLYGTTYYGGTAGFGTVFKLTRSGSGWVLTPLYNFAGGSDGSHPYAAVTIGPNGTLYGATYGGGATGCGFGCGTIFNLRPLPSPCKSSLCYWTETVLYRFTGGADGASPASGVVFDQAGNIYGAALHGGMDNCTGGCGLIYKLVPSNGGWTESVLYGFTGGSDGANPFSPMIFDNSGNLLGTAMRGGDSNFGTVYQLTRSGAGWNESVLHTFAGGADGALPLAGLTFDQSGNLFGTTTTDGHSGGLLDNGTVFELSPSNGSWTETVLYNFTGGSDGANATSGVIFDGAGNLYGSTAGGGAYLNGTVFKLTPSNGGWTESVLHDFTAGSDGEDPYGRLVMDAAGNFYGTASEGGVNGNGIVYQIMPQ